MTYVVLSVAVLVLIAAVSWRVLRHAPLRPLLLTGLVLLALTVVFDNVIVGLDIVAYDDALTSGFRLWHAPVEDLAYALGAVLFIPTVWTWLDRRASTDTGTGAATDPDTDPDPVTRP